MKDDENDDELSSDRDYATTDDGRETPKDLTEEFPLDTSVCVPPQVSIKLIRYCVFRFFVFLLEWNLFSRIFDLLYFEKLML